MHSDQFPLKRRQAVSAERRVGQHDEVEPGAALCLARAVLEEPDGADAEAQADTGDGVSAFMSSGEHVRDRQRPVSRSHTSRKARTASSEPVST